MARLLLFIISFCTFAISYAQEKQSSTRNSSSLDLLYGICTYKQNMNNQLNTFKKFDFGKPIQFVGVSLTDLYKVRGFRNNSIHVSYSQVIPQKVAINDSVNGKINGFNFSCNLIGVDLTPKSKFTSIVIGGGFNTGRLRISSDNLRSQKNPFFAPAFYFNPRFFVGHLVIALRFEYQFDVSKKGWRSVNVSNENNGFLVSNFSHTGLLTYFSLGWDLNPINTKKKKNK